MSEFLKRGAVGQAVGAGPLSPRSGRGNKTDNVFAYIFGKGIGSRKLKEIIKAYPDIMSNKVNEKTKFGRDKGGPQDDTSFVHKLIAQLGYAFDGALL